MKNKFPEPASGYKFPISGVWVKNTAKYAYLYAYYRDKKDAYINSRQKDAADAAQKTIFYILIF